MFWPNGDPDALIAGRFDWFSALLAVAALLGLWRLRAGVVTVIGVCGAAGLIYALVG